MSAVALRMTNRLGRESGGCEWQQQIEQRCFQAGRGAAARAWQVASEENCAVSHGGVRPSPLSMAPQLVASATSSSVSPARFMCGPRSSSSGSRRPSQSGWDNVKKSTKGRNFARAHAAYARIYPDRAPIPV